MRHARSDRSQQAYKVLCFFQKAGKKPQTIERGLTLDEAQRLCRNPETSSQTATSDEAKARTKRHGAWFLGYTKEE